MTDMKDFICGGYVITKVIETPLAFSETFNIVPPLLLTASDCLAPQIPGTWAFGWQQRPPVKEDPPEAAEVGIQASKLKGVYEWINDRYPDEIDWPGICKSLQTARDLLRELLPYDEKLIIIGLGLHKDYVGTPDNIFKERVRENVFPANAQQDDSTNSRTVPGLWSSLEAGLPPSSEGEILGYEPLGMEYGGGFHTWYCNGLHEDAYRRYIIRPGRLGLIDNYEDAKVFTDWVDSDESGAEPVPWRPWLIMGYPSEPGGTTDRLGEKWERGIRKQVYQLNLRDLEEYPVWQFADNERKIGQDSLTLRPYESTSQIDFAKGEYVTKAHFTLSDGSTLVGYIHPDLEIREQRKPTSCPVIVTDRGQVPLCTDGKLDPELLLNRYYSLLGKTSSEVFPLTCKSAVDNVTEAHESKWEHFILENKKLFGTSRHKIK